MWRRGTVPIWWGVNLQSLQKGLQAEVYVREQEPYKGTITYFRWGTRGAIGNLGHEAGRPVCGRHRGVPTRDRQPTQSEAHPTQRPITSWRIAQCWPAGVGTGWMGWCKRGRPASLQGGINATFLPSTLLLSWQGASAGACQGREDRGGAGGGLGPGGCWRGRCGGQQAQRAVPPGSGRRSGGWEAPGEG